MKLHNDKDAFRVIIEKVSKISGIKNDILEKDYYVTLLLKELSQKENQGYAYFKGGTALYKCLHSIKRFSEDIDLTVDVSNCKSETQKRKRLKDSAKSYISLGDGTVIEDLKGSVTTRYGYTSLYSLDYLDRLQRYGWVKIESTSFTISEPIENLEIAPCIYEYSSNEDKSILTNMFDVKPFKILTIKLERIFIDKIFAAQYYFDREMYFDVAKHTYDLTVLMDNNKIMNLLNNKTYFCELIAIERKEELERFGGIPSDILVEDFSFFKNLKGNKTFLLEFNKMQDIYVLNENDKINVDKVFTYLELLLNSIQKLK